MQLTELKKDGLDYHVKVIIPAKKINEEIQKELLDLTKKVRIDGFRSGKVPLSVVSKKYRQSIKNDVLQHQISHTINDIIKNESLKISGEPAIEELKSEDNKDIEFVLKFELLPKIDMPNFKKISLEKPVVKVDKKSIDESIEKLVEFSKEYTKEIKGKAAKGDQLILDAVGYIEEKAFEGGKLTNHKLVLGSKSFIDTFEDQLIGKKAGDEVTVKVTFPNEYHASELAGKKAQFEVKIIAVHKAEVPEVNDEFAKKFNCEDVEKFRKQVEKNIATSYEGGVHTLMKMRLFDELEDILKFDVPTSLLEKEIDALKRQIKEHGDEIKAKSEKEKEKYYKKLSLRRVRIGLLLSEYASVSNFKIEQADIQKAVMTHARNFPGHEAEIVKFYQNNPKALKSLSGSILEEKAVQAIFDKEVNISEKKYSEKELKELLEKEENEL